MNARHHLGSAPQGVANVSPRETQARVFSARHRPTGDVTIATTLRAALTGVLAMAASFTAGAADLRIGIIGTDSSHSGKFGQIFNDPSSKEHVAGARIVCAFKAGSPDMERSRSRVDGFATEMRDKYGVALVDSIA